MAGLPQRLQTIPEQPTDAASILNDISILSLLGNNNTGRSDPYTSTYNAGFQDINSILNNATKPNSDATAALGFGSSFGGFFTPMPNPVTTVDKLATSTYTAPLPLASPGLPSTGNHTVSNIPTYNSETSRVLSMLNKSKVVEPVTATTALLTSLLLPIEPIAETREVTSAVVAPDVHHSQHHHAEIRYAKGPAVIGGFKKRTGTTDKSNKAAVNCDVDSKKPMLPMKEVLPVNDEIKVPTDAIAESLKNILKSTSLDVTSPPLAGIHENENTGTPLVAVNPPVILPPEVMSKTISLETLFASTGLNSDSRSPTPIVSSPSPMAATNISVATLFASARDAACGKNICVKLLVSNIHLLSSNELTTIASHAAGSLPSEAEILHKETERKDVLIAKARPTPAASIQNKGAAVVPFKGEAVLPAASRPRKTGSSLIPVQVARRASGSIRGGGIKPSASASPVVNTLVSSMPAAVLDPIVEITTLPTPPLSNIKPSSAELAPSVMKLFASVSAAPGYRGVLGPAGLFPSPN